MGCVRSAVKRQRRGSRNNGIMGMMRTGSWCSASNRLILLLHGQWGPLRVKHRGRAVIELAAAVENLHQGINMIDLIIMLRAIKQLQTHAVHFTLEMKLRARVGGGCTGTWASSDLKVAAAVPSKPLITLLSAAAECCGADANTLIPSPPACILARCCLMSWLTGATLTAISAGW